MHPVLNQNIFLVKEHVGLFKASSNFDIFNPDTQQVMLHCREENLNFFTKLFRFTDYKKMTPFEIAIKTPNGEARSYLLSLNRRGIRRKGHPCW